MGKQAYVEPQDFEHDHQIYQWVTESGQGLMGCAFAEIPDECFGFVLEQAARFNIPFPQEIAEVAVSGASAAFHYADVVDPYVLLWDVSDVSMTQEWAQYAYEVWGPDGSPYSEEPKPEEFETFVSVPGQAEAFMNRALSHPGLEALPYGIGDTIHALLHGEMNGEELWDSITSDTEHALKALCSVNGELDKRRLSAYFEFSAWAGFIWLAGPLGRHFRHQHHEIIQVALDYGECILWNGTIVPPRYYRKLERPTQSCFRCGTRAWCVEHTMHGGRLTVICEACLNFEMPKFAGATCGTKFCMLTACPNNPYHHHGQEGIYQAARSHGQLNAMARGKSVLRVQGSGSDPRLLPF